MRSPWYLADSGPGNAAYNMALDEALLEAMPRLERAVLRWYAWSEPAASFGYFQKYAEVELMTSLRPLVRRPTGGGLVPHDNDWTYSLTFPTVHAWYGLSALESYRRVHEWIHAAFAKLGVVTELAARSRRAQPGQCFQGYVTSDVLWQGKKIAGAAQRRTRQGLLIQGSVQAPPLSLARADWHQAMLEAAPGEPRVDWLEFRPDPALAERAHSLAEQKYSLSSYLRRR